MYDDETFASACARFYDLFGLSDAEAARESLFGTRQKQSEDFPGRLDHFARETAMILELSIDELIAKHTLFPYICPFLSLQVREQLVSGMHGSGPRRYAVTAYGRRSRITRLRFCPVCATEDRHEFGETFWHRLHQINAVRACPLHVVLLEESLVFRGERTRFITAENSIPIRSNPRPIDQSGQTEKVFIWLAVQIESLLKVVFPVKREMLSELYSFHLGAKALVSIGSHWNFGLLRQLIRSRIPAEVFRSLGLPEVSENISNDWIADTIVKGNGSPLHHLLILYALNLTVAEFFLTKQQEFLFEQGPWPCLNPVCRHYNQSVIQKYAVVREYGTTKGIFTCVCGFTYSRVGPDKAGCTRTRPHLVLERGRVWNSALMHLWADASQTIKHIGKTLSVNVCTVLRAAVKLNLPFSDSRPANKQVKGWLATSRQKKEPSVEKHMKKIKGFLIAHPDASRTHLQKSCGHSVEVVRRRNPEWLEKNSPKRRRPSSAGNPRQDVDWPVRDSRLAKEVEQIRQTLMSDLGRPERISQSRIEQELSFSFGVVSRDRLPKTVEAMSRAVESRTEAAIRRLHWAAKRGDFDTVEEIARAAGMDPRRLESPAFAEAVAHLRKAIRKNQTETLQS
jgi:hypothetical protein